jgi:hypothetical protein
VLLPEIGHVAELWGGAFGGEGPELVEAVREARGRVVELAGDGGVVAVVLEDDIANDAAPITTRIRFKLSKKRKSLSLKK